MIKENKIKLENTVNTRDLGGYTTVSGGKIKYKRLIRSDMLGNINNEEQRILKEEYNLKTIIDLRTKGELENNPDPNIDGVKIIENPLLNEKTLGITKEKKEGSDERALFVKAVLDNNQTGEQYMMEIYKNIITNKLALNGLKNIFNILLSSNDGAVLWHCSTGKDRAGIVTMLILTALGVSSDIIMEDYLKTKDNIKEDNERKSKLAAELFNTEGVYETALCLGGVEESYLLSVYDVINKEFGGMNNFLYNQMGLNNEKINKLKYMYLE